MNNESHTERSILFLLLASSLAFAVQTRRFTKEDLEHELELPSPAWQAVSRLDVHDHIEFVNGASAAAGLKNRETVLSANLSARQAKNFALA